MENTARTVRATAAPQTGAVSRDGDKRGGKPVAAVTKERLSPVPRRGQFLTNISDIVFD